MNFFVDYTQLNQQSASDGYGPDSSNPTDLFYLTSRFTLSSQARAYSPLKGHVIIQPNVTDPNNLVNLILKPQVPLKINFTSVKYFVFRGLRKDSYFTSLDAITPQNAGNNDLIAKLWAEHDDWKISANQPNAPDPDASALGYNSITDTNTPASTKIDSIYANQQTLKFFPIEEGKWIGNFTDSISVGFEVVLEEGDFIPDLNYARLNSYSINVSTIGNAFDRKTKREEVLNFIDPAAFFGLFFFKGLKAKTQSNPSGTTKSGGTLYQDILQLFATKNRVYLDIRNEIGYSLNFYENYNDGSGNQVKVGDNLTTPTSQQYSTSNWPLVVIDGGLNITENRNTVKLNIRIDDNIKPLLYIVHAEQASPTRTVRFLDEKRLLPATVDGFTKELTFHIPNYNDGNSKLYTPWYIKLHYCRQKDSATVWPPTVLKGEVYTDNVFGPLNLQRLGDFNDPFRYIFNQDIKFIDGNLPGSTENFGFIAERGISWDDDDGIPTNDKVIFYARTVHANKTTEQFFADKTGVPQTEITGGISLNNTFFETSLLKQGLRLSFQKITDGTLDINLPVMDDNGVPPRNTENLLMLCITQQEFDDPNDITNTASLKGVFDNSGFKTNHHGYLKLVNEIYEPSQGYYKYEVHVHGIDSTTLEDKVVPTNPLIYVYTKDGLIFSSKAFSDSIPLQSTYTRNYEESIGLKEEVSGTRSVVISAINTTSKQITVSGVEPFYELPINRQIEIELSSGNNGTYTVKDTLKSGSTTIITVDEAIPSATADGQIKYDTSNEDYFIGIDIEGVIGSTPDPMRKIVNDFNKAVELVPNDANAKSSLLALINTYAPKILDRGRAFVQNSNFANPDDRILYWARIKMEVVLKSHPFLLQSLSDSRELVEIFEQKSRGYTSVNFGSTTLKKILITGFDPFQLDSNLGGNIEQSNPAGVVALALHNKKTQDINGNDYALIQSMVFPVRYEDFDGHAGNFGVGNGVVEKYIKQFIESNSLRVDMIVTISQAGTGNFNIDRFATRTRGGLSDNMNNTRPYGSRSVDLSSTESEFEWIQTTLPKAMVPDYPAPISDPNPNSNGHWIIYNQNYQVLNDFNTSTDLPANSVPPDVSFLGRIKDNAPTQLQKGTKIHMALGKNYLSNEIHYRVSLMRERWIKSQLPTVVAFPSGHFHIAKLQDSDDDYSLAIRNEAKKVIDTVKDRIQRGILDLSNLFTNEYTD
jgi:hypothetical protein